MRVPAERVTASADASGAAGADLDGVSAMDAIEVASVSGEFADHRSGFGGPGREITDMVTV